MVENSYEKDFNLWAQQQADALKARQFTRLDYDNLIIEFEIPEHKPISLTEILPTVKC